MADNAYKKQLGQSLNALSTERALNEIYRTGQGLPCHVTTVQVGADNCAVVTVQFDMTDIPFTLPSVSMPVFGPEYVRYPIQIGDKGMAVSADAYIGGVSGLGGGTADLTRRANLTTLVFMPMGNVAWSNVDPNAVTVNGPNGVVTRDAQSKSVTTLTPQGITTQTVGGIGVNADQDISERALGQILIQAGTSMLLKAGTNLTMQDANHSTSPSGMNAAWAALVAWINTHDHTNGNAGANTGAPVSPFNGEQHRAMRTYGRVSDAYGRKSWAIVTTDQTGSNDYVWVTTLCQCLRLVLGEDPFNASYGIPAQLSIITQVFPDYYVAQTQMQFAQYFASLSVQKLPLPAPVYDINVMTNRGVQIALAIPT